MGEGERKREGTEKKRIAKRKNVVARFIGLPPIEYAESAASLNDLPNTQFNPRPRKSCGKSTIGQQGESRSAQMDTGPARPRAEWDRTQMTILTHSATSGALFDAKTSF